MAINKQNTEVDLTPETSCTYIKYMSDNGNIQNNNTIINYCYKRLENS
jgi:hypothetical protein